MEVNGSTRCMWLMLKCFWRWLISVLTCLLKDIKMKYQMKNPGKIKEKWLQSDRTNNTYSSAVSSEFEVITKQLLIQKQHHFASSFKRLHVHFVCICWRCIYNTNSKQSKNSHWRLWEFDEPIKTTREHTSIEPADAHLVQKNNSFSYLVIKIESYKDLEII